MTLNAPTSNTIAFALSIVVTMSVYPRSSQVFKVQAEDLLLLIDTDYTDTDNVALTINPIKYLKKEHYKSGNDK